MPDNPTADANEGSASHGPPSRRGSQRLDQHEATPPTSGAVAPELAVAAAQHGAITSLTRMLAFHELDLSAALSEITRTVACTLDVERVSVWRFNDERNAIVCHDLYERSAQRHSSGLTLATAKYPAYFRALDECEAIRADDACDDPRTREFADSYFQPLGIGSMLDTPVHLGGGLLDGVFCLEHVGPPRAWSALEQHFAVAIANLISLILSQAQRKEAEQASRSLLESIPQIVWVAEPDGWCVQVNKRWVEYTGMSPADTLARGWMRAFHPDDVERLRKSWQASVDQERAFEIEYRLRRGDGVYQWMLGRAVPLRDTAGKVVRWLGTCTNIDGMKQVEAQLKQVTDRFEAAVNGTSDGLFDWWVGEDAVWYSPRFWALLGYAAADERPPGTFASWTERLHSDDREQVLGALDRHIKFNEPFDMRYRMRTAAGDFRWFRGRTAAQRDDAGLAVRVSGSIQDVTDHKRLEDELRAAARMDRLTGLPNRALLMDRLQNAIERHKRDPESGYAVLFMDFDRFKMINDTLGHEAGDMLLREIAMRLQATVRAVDLVSRQAQESTAARLGGDEFVILLDGLHAEADVPSVTERILDALSTPCRVRQHDIVTTASIGIVTSAFGHEWAEDVLRDVDIAMYEAKAAGRGRTAVFDESMLHRVQRKVELEDGLRKALELGQFTVHYQPVISLESKRIHGFEALVRWEHPHHGTILPGEFIPVAEETGLIVPLGEWVFRHACRRLATWWQTVGRDAVPSVSINVSRVQLSLPNLAQRLRTIALEAGADPTAVHIDVTENAIKADPHNASKVLKSLKEAGFQIDLDDFGTGYASMASLHMFPADYLKIDRSFVANLARGRAFAAMVNAIITLADNMNMTLIAVGVETDEQLITLQSLGCELAQGYLFARPMAAEDVPAFAARGLLSQAS